MKLSFSTLGCPEWDWETVIQKGREYGFGGIELRGLQDELDIDKLPPFQADKIAATMAQLKNAGLSLVCIDTSCRFLGESDPAFTFQSAQAAIRLAARLGVPYIRVFGDTIPDGMAKEAAIAAVADGLQQYGSYAGDFDVTVLLETHGGFMGGQMILEVFKRITSSAVGVLWDSANSYGVGEAPGETWSKIGHLVRHVHMKDFVLQGGEEIPCLTGSGEVPLGGILEALEKGKYDGWISFEWEKRWFPSVESPETALPGFINQINVLQKDASRNQH